MKPSPESLIQKSLLSGEYYSDPFPLFDEFRASAPIYFSETIGGWALTRFEDIDAI